MLRHLLTTLSIHRHVNKYAVCLGSNLIRHVAPMCPPMWHIGATGKYDWTCAFFGPPESKTQIANRQVQLFLHSSWQKVPILYNWRPFPTKLPLQPFSHRSPQSVPILYNGSLFPSSKLPLPMEGSGPNLIHGSLGPPKSSTQTASRFSCFCRTH